VKNGPFKRAALPDQSAQILDSAQSAGRVWRRASVAKTLAAEQPGDDGALAEGLKSSFGRSSTQMAPLCLVVPSDLACDHLRQGCVAALLQIRCQQERFCTIQPPIINRGPPWCVW
jgi:hypothetical protein